MSVAFSASFLFSVKMMTRTGLFLWQKECMNYSLQHFRESPVPKCLSHYTVVPSPHLSSSTLPSTYRRLSIKKSKSSPFDAVLGLFNWTLHLEPILLLLNHIPSHFQPHPHPCLAKRSRTELPVAPAAQIHFEMADLSMIDGIRVRTCMYRRHVVETCCCIF